MITSTLKKLAYSIQDITFIENHDDGKVYCADRANSCNQLMSVVRTFIEKPESITRRDLSGLVIKCSLFREKLIEAEHRCAINSLIASLNKDIVETFDGEQRQ